MDNFSSSQLKSSILKIKRLKFNSSIYFRLFFYLPKKIRRKSDNAQIAHTIKTNCFFKN